MPKICLDKNVTSKPLFCHFKLHELILQLNSNAGKKRNLSFCLCK